MKKKHLHQSHLHPGKILVKHDAVSHREATLDMEDSQDLEKNTNNKEVIVVEEAVEMADIKDYEAKQKDQCSDATSKDEIIKSQAKIPHTGDKASLDRCG